MRARALGIHKHIASHWFAREVHDSDMLAPERIFIVCLADPGHEGVSGNADKHETVSKEGRSSKHSPLGDAGLRGQHSSNAGNEVFVERHSSSVRPNVK